MTLSATETLPLDSPQVIGLLLGGGVAGIEQVVDRCLDHVQRVANLVGNSAGDLPEGRQPLAPLKPRHVLGLVGVLDDRQVEVQQLVERADRGLQAIGIALPGFVKIAEQPGAEPGQCDVGIDLVEPDLDVPPADAPAACDILGVVPAREQIADPLHESALESIDLGLPTRDDLACIRVSLDLSVEVVDQGEEVFLQQRSGRHDPLRVGFGPSDIGLEFAITFKESLRVHLGPLACDRVYKKTHAPPRTRSRGLPEPNRTPIREQSG